MVIQRPRPSGLKFRPFGLEISAPWLPRPPRAAPRRLGLNDREQALVERIKRLKKEAGSHSPSAWTLAKLIPELRLKVDACFLSNPYATKLFLMHFHREVIRPRKLRALLELYPSQNRVIATKLGRVLDLEPDSIFVGNGAVEIIQAILHRFTSEKILVNLPTFSPYYEFARPDTQVVFNLLRKEDEFRFDPGAYLELVRRERPDTIVLINPNNPDGGYIPHATCGRAPGGAARRAERDRRRELHPLRLRRGRLRVLERGGRGPAVPELDGRQEHVQGFRGRRHPGRLRRDGARAGADLLGNGYLWNSSGLAEYFFDLYSRPDFQERYERERIRFIRNSRRFFAALAKIDGLHVYPTSANFALVELRNGLTRRGTRLPVARSAAGSTPEPATTRRASSPASSSGSPPVTARRTPTSSGRCAG